MQHHFISRKCTHSVRYSCYGQHICFQLYRPCAMATTGYYGLHGEFQSPHISKLRRTHGHISLAPRLSYQLIPRTSENLMLGPDHNCKVLLNSVFPNEHLFLKYSVKTFFYWKLTFIFIKNIYGGSRLLIVRAVGYVSFGEGRLRVHWVRGQGVRVVVNTRVNSDWNSIITKTNRR